MDGDKRLARTDMILNHATDYYKMLFGPRNGDAFDLDPGLWLAEEMVTSEKNHILTKSFQEEEIKLALFQMEKNKVASPDGLPIEFYQTCWGFIKEDICDLFSNFYCGTVDIKRLNYGTITLLPKVKEASRI
jgi:hypothetical protein